MSMSKREQFDFFDTEVKYSLCVLITLHSKFTKSIFFVKSNQSYIVMFTLNYSRTYSLRSKIVYILTQKLF
jgi:hypothetical protein